MALKNVTITLEEEVARWARIKAAEQNTSVSRLVGKLLEKEMRMNDAYWKAYEEWKKLEPIPGLAAGPKLSRDELHERRP